MLSAGEQGTRIVQDAFWEPVRTIAGPNLGTGKSACMRSSGPSGNLKNKWFLRVKSMTFKLEIMEYHL